MRAADLDRSIEAGMTNVTLATVELHGVEDGTTNLSVEGIDRINDDQGDTITPDTDNGTLTVHKVFPIVGIELPTDPDDDGHYEDITSDGSYNYRDVVVMFQRFHHPAIQECDEYGFNDNDRIDYADIGTLFEGIGTIPAAG